MSQGFNINEITLSGGLTRDPELRSLPSGTAVCNMRLGFSRRRKDASGDWVDEPGYVDLVAFGGLGEWYANNLGKGDQVVVSGELRWREWTPEGEQYARQFYEISVNALIPMGERSGGGSSGRAQRAAAEDEYRGGGFTPREDGGASGFAPRSDVPADTSDFEPAPSSGGSQGDDDIPF